jgi:hypothetical protein
VFWSREPLNSTVDATTRRQSGPLAFNAYDLVAHPDSALEQEVQVGEAPVGRNGWRTFGRADTHQSREKD